MTAMAAGWETLSISCPPERRLQAGGPSQERPWRLYER
jgi:hypothetical protein